MKFPSGRCIRRFCWLLAPFILLQMLMGAMYCPPVQKWAVEKVTTAVRKKTGLDIQLEYIRLSPLLDLDLREVLINDRGERLLEVRSLLIDLNMHRLLTGNVDVERIELRDGNIDTRERIEGTHIRGALKKLALSAHGVNLKHRSVALTEANLKGCDIAITLKGSTQKDTTQSTPPEWVLDLHEVNIEESRLSLHFPGDSLHLQGGIRKAALEQGNIDLEKGLYRARKVCLQADSLHYDLLNRPYAHEGMDFSHLALYDVDINVENVHCNTQASALSLLLSQGSLREKSGLQIDRLTASLQLDSTSLHLKGMEAETPHSTLNGKADLEWAALSTGQKGRMNAHLNADIGKEDWLCVAKGMVPEEMTHSLPESPICLELDMEGNVDSLNVEQCTLSVENVVEADMTGYATQIMKNDHRGADLSWHVRTQNLDFLKSLMKTGNKVAFPPMRMEGNTQMNGSEFHTDATLAERTGKMRLHGCLNTDAMRYRAHIDMDKWQLHDFLPQDSLGEVSLTVQAEGCGTNILSPSTRLEALVNVEELNYGPWQIGRSALSARLKNGNGTMEIHSDNDLLRMVACVEAKMERKVSHATFNLDMSHADLYALGIARDTLSASMVMHIDGDTDLKESHRLNARIEAMELVTKDTVYHPLDIHAEALLEPDTLYAQAEAGDLKMKILSEEGLNEALEKVDAFGQSLKEQLGRYYLDQDSLRLLLPSTSIQLQGGRNNPLCNILRMTKGISFEGLNMNLTTNPEKGLNGKGHIDALNTGGMLLDTLQWFIRQDSTGVNLYGRVRNNPKNKMAVFESLLKATITPTGATARLVFHDAKGKKGVDLGLGAERQANGLRVHFAPLNPIIAYRTFALNEDNFIELGRDGRIQALVDLLADDGTGLKLYSIPNEEAQQDLSLSLNNFNVGELAQVIPYMPDLKGWLHGDVHYMQMDSTLSVSADMQVREMAYQGSPLGNIGMNAVYLPDGTGSHYVDGVVTQNDNEVLFLTGTYRPEKEDGHIEAHATVNRLPLSTTNGFIPDGMAALLGYASGNINITGSTASPVISGYLTTDSMHLTSDMYNINLRFPNDTISIRNSQLKMDHIEAYAAGKSPLVIDGTMDLTDLSHIQTNLGIKASNYELINAPRERGKLAYGKVFVDINAMLRGVLDDLKIRGRLTVLGNTDVTYVLKDSPITVDDQLSGLVTFVDFNDSIESKETANLDMQHIDMQMTLAIEQAAQVHCLLSEDGTDYVELEGGGNLNLTYDPQNDLRLQGRYTILKGRMNYTMLSIVCKNFDIEGGSYVEFQGDIGNPKLQISARERLKASVAENNVPRSVAFDVGLSISRTLKDMGLEFTLQAPEDLTVQNELAGMSSEERGRVAVTMLATNMYITNMSGAGGYSTANALNTFLQGEINNLVGRAQNTIDVNLGMENTTSATGNAQTDYSFSFAKRFWGNRINLIIGGRVSTGTDAVNTGQTLIDNVSLEYRLDKSATRYVKVFYDRNYESLLEGELTEMGAGVVFRRKSSKLGDLFIFKNKNDEKK